ncbi:MAG: hypothetical protein V1690_00225 [Candidatus Moraniibacteriota bacterium]
MEEDNKTGKNPLLTLAVVFIVGVIAGFFIKSAVKTHVTSSPDDRKVTVIKQTYDFKAAQEKLDKEMEQLQSQQQEAPANQLPAGE